MARRRPVRRVDCCGLVCARDATGGSCGAGGINFTAWMPNVSGCCGAGRLPSVNNDGAGDPKCVSSGRRRPNSSGRKIDGLSAAGLCRLMRRLGRSHPGARGHGAKKDLRRFATALAAMSRPARVAHFRGGTAAPPAARRCGGFAIASASGCAARRPRVGSNAVWNTRPAAPRGTLDARPCRRHRPARVPPRSSTIGQKPPPR